MQKNETSQQNTIKTYYPKDSAGAIMTSNVPTCSGHSSIGDIELMLVNQPTEFETINYIYVLDQHRKLCGVISIKELFKNAKHVLASKVMKPSLVVAHVHTDQERVAFLAIKHNIKAVPVTDREGHFLGIIPSDVIMRTLDSEHVENFLKSAGISGRHMPSSKKQVWQRFPWLSLGLIGGVAAAVLIGNFESVLEEMMVLAAFVPAIVYIADAVGAQTQTLLIRSIALNENFSFKRYAGQELKVGFLIAVIFAAAIGLIGWLFWDSLLLGAIFFTSFFFTIQLAVGIAMCLPYAFYKFGFDPAIASGPFATIVRDITSLIIYFGTAQIFLSIT
jgi:magnesium transporter